MDYEEFVQKMRKHKIDVSLSERTKNVIEYTLANICIKNIEAKEFLKTLTETRSAELERTYLIAMVIDKSPFDSIRKAWTLMARALDKIDIGITILDVFKALDNGDYHVKILEDEDFQTNTALVVAVNYLYINKLIKEALDIGDLDHSYDESKSVLEHILARFKSITQRTIELTEEAEYGEKEEEDDDDDDEDE